MTCWLHVVLKTLFGTVKRHQAREAFKMIRLLRQVKDQAGLNAGMPLIEIDGWEIRKEESGSSEEEHAEKTTPDNAVAAGSCRSMGVLFCL